jgi:hypothetical protein
MVARPIGSKDVIVSILPQIHNDDVMGACGGQNLAGPDLTGTVVVVNPNATIG